MVSAEIQNRILETLLDRIIENEDLHGRWLNTLSFLEHSGSRKIHKARLGKYINESILRHASEEARHAYFFKKIMKKISPRTADDYSFRNQLSGYRAYRYFQSLDLNVFRYFKDKINKDRLFYVCYLYVTLLIEERANTVFQIYENKLKEKNIPVSIQSVINEEKRHLEEMYKLAREADPHYEQHVDDLRNTEKKLFSEFLHHLQRRVLPSSEDSVPVASGVPV